MRYARLQRLASWRHGLLLKIASAAAVLGSAYYIGSMLVDIWRFPGGVAFTADLILLILVGAAFYATLHLPLGAAWGILVLASMSAKAPIRAIAWVYGRSQIAKYIPSNVMHFAGRQLLGGRLGWPQAPIAAASLLETTLLILAAGCGMLVLGTLLSERAFELVPASILSAIVAVILLILYVMLRHVVPNWKWLRRCLGNDVAIEALAGGRAIAIAFLFYTVFFVGGGVLCHIVLAHLEADWSWRGAPLSILAFSAAWLAGFVIPGAPGGLGVREAALAYMLSEMTSEQSAVIAALLLRAITLLGDVVCLLLCMGLTPNSQK